jgi:hypothetical protein
MRIALPHQTPVALYTMVDIDVASSGKAQLAERLQKELEARSNCRSLRVEFNAGTLVTQLIEEEDFRHAESVRAVFILDAQRTGASTVIVYDHAAEAVLRSMGVVGY